LKYVQEQIETAKGRDPAEFQYPSDESSDEEEEVSRIVMTARLVWS
jgi:hypothetical protein